MTNSTSAPSQCSTETATQRAHLLMACYRKDDATNPEIYAAALTSVLCCYSEEIVRHVTDPRTGIASRDKWLPSIAEVRAACDNQARLVDDRRRFEAREEARRNPPDVPQIGVDRKAVVARMKERFPDIYGDPGKRDSAQAVATLAAMCERQGVALDSIPDRKGEGGLPIVSLGEAAKLAVETVKVDMAALPRTGPMLLSNDARASLGFPLLPVEQAAS